jgi:hypothetical protein
MSKCLTSVKRVVMQTIDSLRVREFRLLWLAQISGYTAQFADPVTSGWLIFQLTASPTQVGLATALRGLPTLVFGLLAGTKSTDVSKFRI